MARLLCEGAPCTRRSIIFRRERQFSVWFRENQSVLRRSPTERSRNTIIATQLLPIFEAEPRGWEALAFLNSASIDPQSPLAQYLAKWRSRCPQELRSFVTKVEAVFL